MEGGNEAEIFIIAILGEAKFLGEDESFISWYTETVS